MDPALALLILLNRARRVGADGRPTTGDQDIHRASPIEDRDRKDMPHSSLAQAERTLDMTATPIPLIKPANRLFGTISFDPVAMTFNPDQLPSTYYMEGNGPFLRLRPMHRNGFAMLESPTRVVGLYTGAWDRHQSFQANSQNNQTLFHELGDTAADIRDALAQLKQNPVTTQAIRDQNGAQNPPLLNDAVVYVNEGAMAGTIWGGNAAVTNNRYQPMKIVDSTTANVPGHNGHHFADTSLVEEFYANNYPNTLQQLMQLGQVQQSMATVIGPNQSPIMLPLETGVSYFPLAGFQNSTDRQLAFLLRFFGSFV